MNAKISKRIRNIEYKPYFESEGSFNKELPTPPGLSEEKLWYDGLTPNERLFYHQTLNSSRRFVGFKSNLDIPKDSIDLLLLSQYHHNRQLFPTKVDIVLQAETCGRTADRRLKNTKDIEPEKTINHPLKLGLLFFVRYSQT